MLGKVGLQVEPTTSDPTWLGTLPPAELFVIGFEFGGYLDAGRLLLTEAVRALPDDVPSIVQMTTNSERHPDHKARLAVMEACGFELFSEKLGYSWVDEGPIDVPGRLRFESISAIGLDAYRSVMAPCGEGTLDRNDRYYWGGCGPENWAAQMTAFFSEDDAGMWLVGFQGHVPIGFVAVGADEDWGSTIVHIGVVPGQRGHGYINDLVAAGTSAAQRNGIATMLSDVDVLNQPMMAALVRARHLPDRRPWHIWTHWGQVLTAKLP
jgi:ribosomal protein S18 acetylase RimI-like enzyme